MAAQSIDTSSCSSQTKYAKTVFVGRDGSTTDQTDKSSFPAIYIGSIAAASMPVATLTVIAVVFVIFTRGASSF